MRRVVFKRDQQISRAKDLVDVLKRLARLIQPVVVKEVQVEPALCLHAECAGDFKSEGAQP